MSHVVIVSQARVNHVFVSQLLCHGNCYYCKQLAFQTKEDVWPFTIINSEKDSGIGMAGIWNAMSACTICAVFSWKFRPRAHVSGYFGIRNFFSPDTASADTYPANPVYESTSCSFFFTPLSRVEILLILSNFYPVLSPWDVRLFVFYTKTYV